MLRKLRSTAVILGIVVLVFFITTNINWGGNRSKNIIRSDAKCYYLYLPGIFIYHDLNFSFVQEIEYEKYYDEFNCRDCREYVDGRAFSKVTAGVALAQLPFFLGAHVIALLGPYDADGYSTPYQLALTVAAVFYLFIGLFFADKLLKSYDLRNSSRWMVLISAVFGTNLFYYTIGEPGMSHIYSFAFVSMLAYCARMYFLSGCSKYLVGAGLLLGVIFLIRPINMIILPGLLAFSENQSNLKEKMLLLTEKTKPLLVSLACFCLPVVIQVIIFHLQTGKLWIDTYGNERFDFLKPEIMNVLFSYRKGLFLYTPLYLISLIGLFYFYKKFKLGTMVFIVFFSFFTYIVSCWWSWWYGGSFSSRVYVDILVFFMIPLAFLINNAVKVIHKAIIILVLFLVIVLCQIQTYQYRYYIIHWSEMTKEMYWERFLKL